MALGLSRLKALKTDERKQASVDAQKILRAIASNQPHRPRVELPATVDMTSAPTNAVALVRPGRRVHTHTFDHLAET